MYEYSPGEYLTSAVCKLHADSTGLIHSRKVRMMHECEFNPGASTRQGCIY